MSLVVIALGIEVYQVVAHGHCAAGRPVPVSHRSTRGFGAAIAGDALSYGLACACLQGSGATAWLWLLIPVAAHLVYGGLVAFARPLYLRLHDYRLPSIYSDGSFCRSKRIATLLDMSSHVVAALLLAGRLPALVAASVAAAGVTAYFVVFTPAPPPMVQSRRG